MLGGVPWAIGFFFSGLVLRSHYKNANWETQSHSDVLIKTVASAALFGFFIVAVMSLASLVLESEFYLW